MSVAGVELCPGSVADLDAVMTVMDDSFDPAFGEAWTAPQCAGLLPMGGVWLLLARQDDAVIGFALARAILREAELLLLAVRRGQQGRGIGQMLLDALDNSVTCLGTRGSVLIDIGRIKEGRAILEEVLAKTESTIDKCYSHVVLAQAEEKGGNRKRATQLAC